MISRRFYNFILGACILWGFVINFIMCKYFSQYFLAMNQMLLLIGYIVLAIIGVVISEKSQNALISFIGYNLVVMPLGAVLSVVLDPYKNEIGIVVQAVMITAIVTFIMITLSIIFPDFFRSLGKVLFISLLILVITELALIVFTHDVPIIFSWLGCGIFCGYVGYDIVKAQDLPPTVDNAVDMAVSLYLDIINLFLRILEILSNSKDD